MLNFLQDSVGIDAGTIGLIAVIILIIVAAVIVIKSIVIVPQANAVVVEKLGKYSRTLDAGFHILLPIAESISNRVSLKEKVADFPPQPVITKDNVTMQIDTVVYFSVTDPVMYTYGVERPMQAIENLTATTLRNLLGDLELDQTLTSRDTINVKMREILDEATDPWGIKINRVELKNILPPRDIQDAMEKQMRAERQKREAILRADGEKQAAILSAQGEKEAAILRAEAQKIAVVTEADGQAEALLKVAEAQAKGIQMINEANPNAAYLALKGYESLVQVANGQATKIIVPSNIQDISGLLAASKAIIEKDEK